MFISEMATASDLERVFPVLRELRSNLTFDQYCATFREAREHENFRLLGMFDGATCVGVMGYRILHDFVHGRHLYVDDLVVTAARRGQGLGSELLREAEKIAKTQNCSLLRLCTGIENERGKEFYEAEGWTLRAVAFKKPVPSVR